MEVAFFKKQTELRKWFEVNHDQLTEVWIGYFKKSTKIESITWEESVEEALCFGWIDGIRKSIDEKSYKIRFTPRKPTSNWSLKNIKTIDRLIECGLVNPLGLKAYEMRKDKNSGVYSFEQQKIEFSKEFNQILKGNIKAAEFFFNQAPYYQRMATHWVMSAKQEKTRLKRLNQLIEDCINGVKIKSLR